MRSHLLLLVIVLSLLLSLPCQAAEYQKLSLQPGYSEVIEVFGVHKLAIGNPEVVQAKLIDSTHLLVNAVGVGRTNMLLLDSDSVLIKRVVVEVSPWQMREVQDYIKYLIGPTVNVIEVNGQVFVWGVVDGDPEKLTQAITQRFPGIAVRLKNPESKLNIIAFNGMIQQNLNNPTLTLKLIKNDLAIMSGRVVTMEEYHRIEQMLDQLPFRVVNLVELVQVKPNHDSDNTQDLIDLLGALWPSFEFVQKGNIVAIIGSLPPEEFQAYQQIIKDQVEKGNIVSLVKTIPNTEPILPEPKLQQIRVRLHLLELNRQDISELGFDWDNSIPFKLEGTDRGFFQIGSFVRDGDLISRLRLLSSKGKVRILAEPELTTVEGEKAQIHVGGEIPVSDGDGVQWKEYGIQFTIIPKLAGKQNIELEVQAVVSSLDWTNQIELGAAVLPAISSSSFSTVLCQPSGTSSALGGILERRTGRTQSGIPGLANLPLVGELFSWDKTEMTERELVAIISAFIIDDGSDVFEKEDDDYVHKHGGKLSNDLGL